MQRDSILAKRDRRPWIIAAVAGLMIVAAVAFRWMSASDEATRLWAFHTLMEVAVVLIAISLSWNQIQGLKTSTYGRTILIGLFVVAATFAIRPQLIKSILPLTSVLVVAILVLTFFRDFFKPKT